LGELALPSRKPGLLVVGDPTVHRRHLLLLGVLGVHLATLAHALPPLHPHLVLPTPSAGLLLLGRRNGHLLLLPLLLRRHSRATGLVLACLAPRHGVHPRTPHTRVTRTLGKVRIPRARLLP